MKIRNIPVNNFIFVQILQSKYDTSSVENRSRLRENIRVDVHHQVSARGVLHHEAHVALQVHVVNGWVRHSK